MAPHRTWPHWDYDEHPDDHERPATPADRAALDALLARGVDLDALEPAHIDRLRRAEKARMAAQLRAEHERRSA